MIPVLHRRQSRARQRQTRIAAPSLGKLPMIVPAKLLRLLESGSAGAVSRARSDPWGGSQVGCGSVPTDTRSVFEKSLSLNSKGSPVPLTTAEEQQSPRLRAAGWWPLRNLTVIGRSAFRTLLIQQLDDVVMSAALGPGSWRGPGRAVREVDVGAVIQQQGDHVTEAVACGPG